MKKNASKMRNQKASFIAEAPFALWALFFLFTFPFLDMATVLLRYTFIVAAARDGVHAAAQSKTFLTNASSTQVSAVNSAPAAVTQTASAFTEVQVNTVTTYILATNITNLQVSQYSAPLLQPADTTTYLYEIETVVQGTISPLIDMSGGALPAIPGLTTGVPVTVAAREYCEFPQGLNQ